MYITELRTAIANSKCATIGVLGRKGSGKDTAGEFLREELGFYTTSFAKKLYEEVAEAFGISVAELEDRATKEQPISKLTLGSCKDGDFWKTALLQLREEKEGRAKAEGWIVSPVTQDFILSPRKALQLWGTEFRRKQDNMYWIKWAAKDLKDNGSRLQALLDVREPHEAAFVKRRDNGFVLKVVRPNNPYAQAGSSSHSSETLVDSIVYDAEVSNSGTIEDFHETLFNLLG